MTVQTHAPDPGNRGPADRLREAFDQRFQDAVLLSVVESFPPDEQRALVEQVDDLTVRLASLIEATREIQLNTALEPLLNRLIDLISNAFDADRSTLFLYDRETHELFSRVAQGALVREIRFDAGRGIAGWVFASNRGAIVNDAYADERFNPAIDSQTGYHTQSILCVPVKLPNGEIVGVIEVLNRRDGEFNLADQALLEAFATQIAFALEYACLQERSLATQREQKQIMEVTRAISSELSVDSLLARIMRVASDLLDAERSTLFLLDKNRGELWSRVAEGLGRKEIRIPQNAGIAGEVFQNGRAVNIPDAYADPRFNAEVDRETGYRTRTILAVPIINKSCETIGVMEVLNRRGGVFSLHDQRRLELLAAQSAIALDNARLFQDAVDARTYSENILSSLSNGVLTVDRAMRVVKVNRAVCDILGVREAHVLDQQAGTVFYGGNRWIADVLEKTAQDGEPEQLIDVELTTAGSGDTLSVNLNATPLFDPYGTPIGTILVIEDVSKEKRMRTTMRRYMAPEVADELIRAGDAILGGRTQRASIMFCDLAGFTEISERLGAHDTVQLLNRFFAAMTDVVHEYGGILDKYIGDAMMAVFGTPFQRPDDAKHAVSCGLAMLRRMEEFNAQQRFLDGPVLHIRIGVNTDEVVVGNIGCQRRMDYTVIGDGVNIAARLESANKFFGTQFLASESTVAAGGGDFVTREVDTVKVAGKQKPIRVFEILAAADDSALAHSALASAYTNALAAYRDGDFDRARVALDALLQHHPDDRPAARLLERVRGLSRECAADWQPVTELAGK